MRTNTRTFCFQLFPGRVRSSVVISVDQRPTVRPSAGNRKKNGRHETRRRPYDIVTERDGRGSGTKTHACSGKNRRAAGRKSDVRKKKQKKNQKKNGILRTAGPVMGCVGYTRVRMHTGTVCLSVRKKPIARRRIVSGHCDRAARAASGVSSNRDTGTCDGTRMSRSA